MQYTNPNGPSPLTIEGYHPGWDDYLDLSESVNEMAQCLMEEDSQQGAAAPATGASPQPVGATLITPIPPDHTVMVAATEFPGSQCAGSSRDNPTHLSDANDTSTSGGRPTKDADAEDDATVLGHYSNALREMANSIMGLEEGYFKALSEVIDETERALWDMSRIDAHYISQVVTVMSSWQEAVQTVASHMEGVDLTTYLTRLEDTQRATHEYVKAVVQAHEERDAAHAVEHEKRKEALKANDLEDPVVCLLHVTCKAVRVHCERAIDAFIDSIKATLHQHIPTHAQGPLIANTLSTAFQFQMAIWRMVGEECVRPIRTRHSDSCGLAGIVQAIVETFPKNCALMFPPIPVLVATPSFTSMFKPASSDEDEDDDDTLGSGRDFRRFETSTPTPADGGHGGPSGSSGALSFSSSSLPYGGAFIMASDNEPPVDPQEVEMLKTIIMPVRPGEQPSVAPKSGSKRSSTHLDGGAASSESSAKDLDASHSSAWPKKKVGMPTKSTSPNEWSKEDINLIRQIQYKSDLQCFQMYHTSKINPADLTCINTVNHSKYLEVAHADPGSVVDKSVFSVAAYRAMLEQQGGDVAKFDAQVGSNFKKGAKGSRAPNSKKVPIDRVMLVCQWEYGVDMAYSDPDGFGRLVTMGLWDLHSTNALSWAKMQLSSGLVDTNFCPMCSFWSTNNETLNNHVRKHYHMGLT